jgi:hypothetical protein
MTPTDPRRTVLHREPPPADPECVVGETLCRVRVLTEQEWAALPPGRQPRIAEHFPGLGWVVAAPGGCGSG